MRAWNLLAAGLVIAAMPACSKPSADASLDAEFESELALALFASESDEADGAVVSALELGRPEEQGESPRAAPAQETAPLPAESPEPVSLVGTPVASVATVGASLAPSTDPVDVSPAGPGPTQGDRADRRGGGLAGIIIRGGISGRDPCKIHLPGRGLPAVGGGGHAGGGVGVLINDRAPRRGSAGNMPSAGRRGGGPAGVSLRGRPAAW